MSSTPSATRPVVFMDVKIGETPAGRIKMELFSDVVPKYALKAKRDVVQRAHGPTGLQKTFGSCALGNIGNHTLSIRAVGMLK